GIARNRNCPAFKNLRRSVANPVGARRCATILSDADHFQTDVLQRSRVGGSIVASAALRIRSKAVCSARRELRCHAPPKKETARWPGCQRHAPRRSAPSPSATLQRSECNGSSKRDVQAFERNRQPQRRCFYPTLAEDATIHARELPMPQGGVADDLPAAYH